MKKSKLAFLNNFFRFEHCKLAADTKLSNAIKEYYSNELYKHFANLDDYKYGVGLVEVETMEPITFALANNEKEDYSSFEFYLNQLPDLSLKNVALLFALSRQDNVLIDDIFKIPAKYPSSFAQSLLGNTCGQVVFTCDFMHLLSCCLPDEENTFNQINEYRKAYNKRDMNSLRRLEELRLPDGANFYALLEEYTPFRVKDETLGLICFSTHKLAFEFIQKAKRYV